MQENEALIIERSLSNKIDENRGDLSRREFIEFCVHQCLEKLETEQPGPEGVTDQELMADTGQLPAYATRDEFGEFKQGVMGLLRTFMDFFVNFGLQLGAPKNAEQINKLKGQLRNAMEQTQHS